MLVKLECTVAEEALQCRPAENQQIPSETIPVEHFGVAWMTVRHAMQVLQPEYLVLAEHSREFSSGCGHCASPRRRSFRPAESRTGQAAFIAESDMHPSIDNIVIREERASPEISRRLCTTRMVLARHRRLPARWQARRDCHLLHPSRHHLRHCDRAAEYWTRRHLRSP